MKISSPVRMLRGEDVGEPLPIELGCKLMGVRIDGGRGDCSLRTEHRK